MSDVTGRFIVFEGGEATGKSTQAALLARRLGAVLTREPGATALGAALRNLVLEPGAHPVDERAEALIMAADRAQHVAEVVRPALAAGRDVVSDRYLYSSLAYQGHGRGLDLDEVRALSTFATAGLEPDRVVLLTVAADVRDGRLASRPGGGLDRIEADGPDFHRRVEDGFLALAAADPSRWCVVDGDGSIDEVAARIRAELSMVEQ